MTDVTVYDRDAVVRVALELLGELGLEGLTMRRLAQRLGVTAASLYWHVRDKDELLSLLAETITAEVPVVDPDQPWRDELRRLAFELRRVARSHRDAVRLLTATPPSGPERLRRIEAQLELLRRAGFPTADLAEIGHVLNMYLTGVLLEEALSPAGAAAGPLQHTQGGGTAPVGPLAAGRLVVTRGAYDLSIGAHSSPSDLYRVGYQGRPPEIDARDGTVRLTPRAGRRGSCRVTLNDTLPWEIEVEGGASRMVADLAEVRLGRLDIGRGARDTTLRLPSPAGSVPVRIGRAVRKLRVERPRDAAIRVHVRRAARRLALDGLQLRSSGPDTWWESPGSADAADVLELEVGGGASELTIMVAGDAPEPGANGGGTSAAGWFATLPADEYPLLVSLADELAGAPPYQDRTFELGLQVLLDGLERRLSRS